MDRGPFGKKRPVVATSAVPAITVIGKPSNARNASVSTSVSPRPKGQGVTRSGIAFEVEASDGTKHRWSNGEMFLADDVGSRGHRTRTIGGPARVLFVHLPPETQIGV